MTDEQFVWVRRQAKDWRLAKYRLADVSNVQWDPSSGSKSTGNQPLLNGQVSCDALLEGELSHAGSYGPCPHTIKVHIVKKENDPKVFSRLAELAGPPPKRS